MKKPEYDGLSECLSSDIAEARRQLDLLDGLLYASPAPGVHAQAKALVDIATVNTQAEGTGRSVPRVRFAPAPQGEGRPARYLNGAMTPTATIPSTAATMRSVTTTSAGVATDGCSSIQSDMFAQVTVEFRVTVEPVGSSGVGVLEHPPETVDARRRQASGRRCMERSCHG